ncbi:hypothetical protein BBP40_008687 [Aspergillus hancockii]|nr:hypothetical protein BBP40_008687 [Aspergillus hancockii]
MRDATTQDIPFHTDHPRRLTHIKHLALTPAQIATVTLQGQLTEFQTAEDSLPGGHPNTDAILNDLAEVLLGLFIPWQRIAPLFQQQPVMGQSKQNTHHHVWLAVEPTLPPQIRTFANNIELLQKSKEDCQADALLRKQSAYHASAADKHLDNLENPPLDSNNDLFKPNIDETYNTETLLTAFSSIRRAWDRELYVAQRRITALPLDTVQSLFLDSESLRPLEISSSVLYEASGLRFLDPTTLQKWEMCLKDLNPLANQDTSPDEESNPISDLDDFNIDITDGTLVLLLTDSDILPDLEERRSRVGQTPTGASLTRLTDYPYNSSQREQTLLYIGGEGGVGKSQIVKAIVAAMDLVHRKHEIILMAPTGAAADIIGGNTYHTSLGISLNRSQRTGMAPRIRRL